MATASFGGGGGGGLIPHRRLVILLSADARPEGAQAEMTSALFDPTGRHE
jgi:hypothetical protein